MLSELFGVVLLFRPGEAALALVLAIGGFAIVYGAFLLGFAFRLRRLAGNAGVGTPRRTG